MTEQPLSVSVRYTLIRQEIRDEHAHISNRLSWYVSSQAFLVSGFAISSNPAYHMAWFNHVELPCLAWLLSAIVTPALVGAVLTIKAWTATLDHLWTQWPEDENWLRVKRPTWIPGYALFVPVVFPLLFLVFWGVVVRALWPTLGVILLVLTLAYWSVVLLFCNREDRHSG